MSLDNSTLIRRDATRCMVLAISAMFILCFTAYRRRWLAVVTFLPSLFGTLMAGAVLALVDEHLSAIAIGFASMAIGITVDYGIYVVYHLDNAATDRETAGKIVGRLVLPTFIGAMTIIAAFIVLACSPMRGSMPCWHRRLHSKIYRGGYRIFLTPAVAYSASSLLIPKRRSLVRC